MSVFSNFDLGDAALTAATGGAYLGYKGLIGDPMAAKNAARAGFNPYSGMPNYPNYVGMEPQQLMPGQAGQRFTQESMRSGPSEAAKIAKNNQGYLANASQDQLRKQANSTAADAKNAVAMKGGLNSGQAGLINMEAGNNALETGQAARDTAAKNIGQIDLSDESARMGQLKDANAMNDTALGRIQLENTKQNAFNLGGYQSAMAAWAGNKQAQATANSGKK